MTIGQIKWNQINNAVVGKWVKPLTVQCVDDQRTKKGRGGERDEVRIKTQLRNRGQIQGKKSLKSSVHTWTKIIFVGKCHNLLQ